MTLAVIESTGTPRLARQLPGTSRKADEHHDLVPVFSPDVLTFVGRPDSVFANHGYLRPQVVLSGKSGRPEMRSLACFAFRLRLLFGPGSRSEVIRILLLLKENGLDASRIADEAAFAKRNIADTLMALTEAEAVVARWFRNERVFTTDHQKWLTFLGTEAVRAELPAFVSWTHLLPAVLHILAWLEREADSTDSGYLLSSRGRDLAAQLTKLLQAVGIPPPPPERGTAFIPGFTRTIESVLASLQPQQ